MNEERANTVSATILGKEYVLRAGDDTGYVQQVAKFVKERTEEMKNMAPSITPVEIAVLTAINIADELLKIRHSAVTDDDVKEARDRIRTLIKMLDR